jgi:hypothetical protein
MVRALIERKDSGRLNVLRHDYFSSLVQSDSTRPTIALTGNAPK